MLQVLGYVAHINNKKKKNHDAFRNLEFSLPAYEISSVRRHLWLHTRSRIGAPAAAACWRAHSQRENNAYAAKPICKLQLSLREMGIKHS